MPRWLGAKRAVFGPFLMNPSSLHSLNAGFALPARGVDELPGHVRRLRVDLLDGVAIAGDPEGFSAGQRQFDSDITEGRYPRAALGIAPGKLLAVVCDGRADDDAGLSMGELAETLVALGAHSAINLDGGGSASLVAGGRL